jgi:hypothetical protein
MIGWEVFDRLLRQVAPRIGGSAQDMPNEAPKPKGWSGSRFGNNPTEEPNNYIVHHEQFHQHQPQQQIVFSHPTSTAEQAAFDINAWVTQASAPQQSIFAADTSSYGFMPTAVSTHGGDVSGYPYMSNFHAFTPAGRIYGTFDEFGPWQPLADVHNQEEGIGGLQLGTSAGDGGYMGDTHGGGMGYDWSGGAGH